MVCTCIMFSFFNSFLYAYMYLSLFYFSCSFDAISYAPLFFFPLFPSLPLFLLSPFSLLPPPFSSGLVSNNVPITIQRHGFVGNVQVTWSTGLLIDGVANGSLTPSTGSYFMAAETPQLTINFTVRN